MIDCLLNHIAFSPNYPVLSPEVSESGYYLTQLPGISVEMADRIRNTDESVFSDIWNNAKQFSHLRLENDFYIKLAQIRKIKPENLIYKASPVIQGNTVTLLDQSTTFKKESHSIATFNISKVIIFAQSVATDVIVLCRDKKTLQVIAATTIDLAIGRNEVPLIVSTPAHWIEISVVGHGGIYANDIIEDTDDYCCCENDNIDLGKSGTDYFLWADVELRCSIVPVICENKKLLTEAYLNLLGFFLLERKIAANIGSERMNFFTTSNIEVTEVTRNRYLDRYNEILDNVITIVEIKPDMCFGCGTVDSVRYEMVHT